MTANSDSEPACKTCGAAIPAEAPAGLCPACLLRGSRPEGAPASTLPDLEEIGKAFPELEITALIGRGGMGAVYRARQPQLDREIALKILLPTLGTDPSFAERFSREARALAKLNHPNIVTIYDFGEREGLFYLAMEFVDGVNLRGAMEAGRFTPEQALVVIPGICDALSAAHGQGILHRDIKPENILLDRAGQVKIVDFGIARIVGDPQAEFTLTEAGAVLGSRQYMAPEQIEGSGEVDHRADIYSLGVVFYEMLTGELPIGRFRPPSEKSSSNEAIDAVVLRALEKELDRRFQSAGEVKTSVQKADQAPAMPASQLRPDQPVTPGKSIGGMARLNIIAVALFLSGAVLLAIGFLCLPGETLKDRYRILISGEVLNGRYVKNGILIVTLLTVGAVAGLLGYGASWLGLKAIDRHESLPRGRLFLYLIVIGMPTCATLFLITYLAIDVEGYWENFDGFVLNPVLLSAAATFAVGWTTARWAGFTIKSPRRRKWMMGLLVTAFLAEAGHLHFSAHRWPFSHSKQGRTVYFHPDVDLDPATLQSAVKTAAGKYYQDYKIEIEDRAVSVEVLYARTKGHESILHLDSFVQRLYDALPAHAIIGTGGRSHGVKRLAWQITPLLKPKIIAYMTMVGVLAAAFALLGGRSGFLGGMAMLAVLFAIKNLPPLPHFGGAPRPISTEPLGQLPPQGGAIDLSTPEGAARALSQTANQQDDGLLQRLVTKAEWERRLNSGRRPTYYSLPYGRILRLERLEDDDDPNQIHMKIDLIDRQGHRGGTVFCGFTSEDGEWKFNGEFRDKP